MRLLVCEVKLKKLFKQNNKEKRERKRVKERSETEREKMIDESGKKVEEG